MTRKWNIIRAKLADPFDPDWDRVNQQVEAMIAEQDARGGHRYPPFSLPDPKKPSTSPAPVSDSPGSFQCTLPNHSKPRKVAAPRDDPDSLDSKLDRALTASKRAASGRTRDGARSRDIPDPPSGANVSKLDQPLRNSKRKAGDAGHDEKRGRGRGAKRHAGLGDQPTASPFEDN